MEFQLSDSPAQTTIMLLRYPVWAKVVFAPMLGGFGLLLVWSALGFLVHDGKWLNIDQADRTLVVSERYWLSLLNESWTVPFSAVSSVWIERKDGESVTWKVSLDLGGETREIHASSNEKEMRSLAETLARATQVDLVKRPVEERGPQAGT